MAIKSPSRSDARDCERATVKTLYDFVVATGLKDLEAIQKAWELARPSQPKIIETPDPYDFLKLFE